MSKSKPDFQEQKKDSLIDLPLNDSTELWLLQWPANQAPDFDGQEVTLGLHRNGELGSFQGSSGKNYDVVSFKSHDPEEMVLLTSASDAQIVGRISRRVSLVHYPEPAEFQKQDKHAAKILAQRSSATSLTKSRRTATPTQTVRPRSFQASAGTSSPPSSRNLSSEHSRSPKKRRVDKPTSTYNSGPSEQDSARGHSNVTSTGSVDMSTERKSKKKKRSEG